MTTPSTANPTSRTRLGFGTVLGYGSGSIATGAYGTVPGLLLLPFLTDTIGIAALAAGLVVVLPKVWDVVMDPIAGRISDRSHDPRGQRRPFLIRAGGVLALGFIGLFAVPDIGSNAVQAAWVVVAFLICATAFSFFQVPYVAMPAEMTDSYYDRTRLMTVRVVILALTILVAGGLAPLLTVAVDGRNGYRLMGVLIAALIFAGAVGAYRGTASAPVSRHPSGLGTMAEQLRVVAAAPDFRRLLITFVIQGLAIGTMLAGVAYVADDVLDRPAFATFLFLCFVGPSILVTPLWRLLGESSGKKTGYVMASVVLAVGAAGAVTAATSTTLVLLATAVVGIGYSGCQLFPLSMLPDAAAVDAHRTGESRAGVYTGVWTAGETLGLALGPGVFALLLAIGGYQSGADQTQPDSAVQAITLGFSLLPAALILLSLISLRRYSLTAAEVEALATAEGER